MVPDNGSVSGAAVGLEICFGRVACIYPSHDASQECTVNHFLVVEAIGGSLREVALGLHGASPGWIWDLAGFS